jgi:hypothetical protein
MNRRFIRGIRVISGSTILQFFEMPGDKGLRNK